MRIAMLGPSLIPIPPDGYGAVEKHIANLSRELRHKGHFVEILNGPHGKLIGEVKWSDKLIRIIRSRQHDGSDWDILHAHTSFLAMTIGALHDIVYTSHCPYWNMERKGPLEYWGMACEVIAIQDAKKVIALTPELAEKFKPFARRVHVVNNGVDTDLFKPDFESREGNNVVVLGKVIPSKGVHTVAKALVGLDCNLHIIGPQPDPAYALEIVKINHRLMWHSNLTELELAQQLSQTDVFVHASVAEAQSMAVLEAMASGLPIVEETAENRIRDRVRSLLKDDKLRSIDSHRSRQMSEQYSWSKVAEKVVDVYES